MSFIRSSEIVRERCSGREGGVVVSWNQKIGYRPTSFLPHYLFFRPFVSVPRARLTVLAGEAFSVVTHPGKVYHDCALDVRLLADRILAIGHDDVEERGIPDESEDSSDDMSENGDVKNSSVSCEDNAPHGSPDQSNEESYEEEVVDEVIDEIHMPMHVENNVPGDDSIAEN
jgi:hypothetical protein